MVSHPSGLVRTYYPSQSIFIDYVKNVRLFSVVSIWRLLLEILPSGPYMRESILAVRGFVHRTLCVSLFQGDGKGSALSLLARDSNLTL